MASSIVCATTTCFSKYLYTGKERDSGNPGTLSKIASHIFIPIGARNASIPNRPDVPRRDRPSSTIDPRRSKCDCPSPLAALTLDERISADFFGNETNANWPHSEAHP